MNREPSAWAVGWAAFAGVMMVLLGIWWILAGLVAIFNDDFYVVGAEWVFQFSTTTWGWIHLLLGIVVLFFSLGPQDIGEDVDEYCRAMEGGDAELGKDIAMHVAAHDPRPVCVSEAQVPAEMVAREREFFAGQARESGKPENIIEKMIEGRIRKFLGEITLLGQSFVKDPDQSVGKLLESAGASVTASSAPARLIPCRAARAAVRRNSRESVM